MAGPLDLEIVTLDNFNRNYADSRAQKFFMGMIQLRKDGYGPEYPESYLPFDSADYFCWHHLICKRTENGLVPIAGFRQVPLSRADYHHETLPLLLSAQRANSKVHIEALERIFNEARKEGVESVHSGGLTIRKEERGDRAFSTLVRELAAALTYVDTTQWSVKSIVTGAVMRFKTHLWFETVGFRALGVTGEPLVPLCKVAAGGEPMLLMKLDEPSAWAKACFEKHQLLMRRRVIIGRGEIDVRIAA